jgi:aspartyl-tRNA(Asn)/glutamyl-tRNA(Gln) amidotransferase subunit A
LNGITGLKPTFGLVSTSGCIPITFSFDVVWPMARTAADCALLMSALAGPDPSDHTTLLQPRELAFPHEPRGGDRPLEHTRIGVPRFAEGFLAGGIAVVFDRFQDELRGLGATLVPFDRPPNPVEDNGGTGAGWMTVLGAEAMAIHAQFAERTHLHRPDFVELFDPMTQHIGTAVEYVRAQMKRAELAETWAGIFASLRLDAVIEPGNSGEIWKLTEEGRLDPASLGAAYAFHGTWNDTNFPALSVPAGLSPSDGGPVGIQVIGLPFSDPHLLQIAIDYQAATEYHAAVPAGLQDASYPPYVPPPVPDGGPQPAYVPVRSPFDIVMIPDPSAQA